MYGAILGDIIGSPYEFDRGTKTKAFPLFSPASEFTDDTVMTIAVAEAFLDATAEADEESLRKLLIERMQYYGKVFPNAGYGARFIWWLRSRDPQPYGSYGNGSAMRVSSCGLIAVTLEEALELAEASAEVTHNHPEGIKGAKATAAAIFLAKTGHSKAEIRDYIHNNFFI